MSTRKRLLLLASVIVVIGVRYLLWLGMGEPLRPTRLGLLSIALIAAI